MISFVLALALPVSPLVAYAALFGLIALESMGVPLPGETALIAAGILAHQGRLDIALVVSLAAAAAILGDNAGYLIGRKGGRWLLERPGPLLRHRKALLARGEPFFERHGAKAVFFGRWVSGLRIASAWLAGINRMHWPVFLFWNALGGVAWGLSIGILAYVLGPTAEQLVRDSGLVGVAIVVLLLVGVLGWRWLRHRRAGPDESGASASAASS
jgi:membrane-associated protein